MTQQADSFGDNWWIPKSRRRKPGKRCRCGKITWTVGYGPEKKLCWECYLIEACFVKGEDKPLPHVKRTIKILEGANARD